MKKLLFNFMFVLLLLNHSNLLAQYQSSEVTIANANDVALGTTDQEVLRLEIVCGSSGGTLEKITIKDPDATNTYTNIKAFYTGSSNVFSTTTQYGNTIATPTGNNTADLITGSLSLSSGSNYFWITCDVPSGATVGEIVNFKCTWVKVDGNGTAPTNNGLLGQRTIVASLANMTFNSCTAAQPNTNDVSVGADDQEILRLDVVMDGSQNPLDLTEIKVRIDGTTDINDITDVKIWYTGANNSFSTSTQFGSTQGPLPAGTNIVFTGTQTLGQGTNYFWVTYSISSSATVGNIVDAKIQRITVDGTARTPTVQEPAGNRKIIDGCQYTLKMYDEGGDGWQGGKMTVKVNGTPVLTDVTVSSGSNATEYFIANTGDLIETFYTAGTNPEENRYEIINPNGKYILSDGTETDIPASSGISGYGDCLGVPSFSINGNSYQIGDECILITEDKTDQSGSVWYNYKVDLTNSFDIEFKMYFGTKYYNDWGQGDDTKSGADGMYFVLQNECTNSGGTGASIGYGGITPSIGIEFDTWYNDDPNNEFYGDPTDDHFAIQYNGSADHYYNALAGPISSGVQFEDGNWHDVKVTWDPSTQKLSMYFDDMTTEKISYTGDIVNDIFGGNPIVFWGFTGATGGASNRQEVCVTTYPTGGSALTDATINLGDTYSGTNVAPGANSYSWSPDDGSISDPTIANPTFTPTVTTSYVVEIEDACGNTFKDQFILCVSPTISVSTPATCSADLQTYSVSVDVSAGIVTSTAGTVTDNGNNNWTIDQIPAGTDITLTVESGADFCTETLDITAPDCSCSAHPVDAPISGGDQEECEASPIQTLTATASVNAGEVVDWYDAATGGSLVASPTLNSVGTVTYYAEARNTTTNCVSTTRTPVTLTINPLPTATAISNSPICEGDNVALNEVGGDATSWSWSGPNSFGSGIQNPTIIGVTTDATGTYYVTVTDGNNCSNISSVNVTVDDAPEVSAGSNQTICANETVTLNGSYGGGASSITWTTSGQGTFDNANSISAVYTPAGTDIPAVGDAPKTITLTITTDDPAGSCGAVSDDMTLTINPMEDASFFYSSGSYCNTADDPTPTITGVTGGTFSASPGITINPTTGQLDVSSGTVGQTYTITYTTPGTCSNSSSVTVTINSGADAEFSYPTPVCSSSANPLPSHTTGSDGVYSSTAGLVFANTSTGEIDLAASTPGTYTITNYVDLGNCGDDTKTFDITIDEAAEVYAGTDQVLCETDGSYVLSEATMGGSATSVTWSTTGLGSLSNSGSINATYNFGSPETVTLTVTTNDPGTSCNAVSDQIQLTINDAAEVDAGSDAAICAGETYTLSGSMAGATSNITWSAPTASGSYTPGTFDDVNSLNATYTPSQDDIENGSVVLTISSDDPSGPCGVVSDNMTLTIHPLPNVVAGSNSPVCEGSSLNITESGANAVSWSWTGPNGFTSNDQNPSQSNIQLSASGTYTVIATDANGCSNTDAVTVVVNPTPTVSATSNSPICSGDTLLLSETGGEADAWSWIGPNGFTSSEQNPIHTNSIPSETGTYYVIGTISSTGCSAQALTNVTINPLPNVVAHADETSVCEGTAVTLTGSGAVSYVWNNGASNDTPIVSPLGSTDYIVVGTDANSCSNSDTISILVYDAPEVSAGNDATICANETYQLNAYHGGGATSVHWVTSGTGTFSDATIDNPIYTPSSDDLSAGSVTLTVTTNDPTGPCDAISDDIILSFTPMDDPYFSYESGTFCETGSNPIPNQINTVGGVFLGTNGLVINSNTGEIDLSATGIGTFTVKYLTTGTCPDSSTFDVTITSGFDAEFFYDSPVCNSSSNPLPHHNTGSNGNYSSTAGLVFVNSGTGEIDLSASLPGVYIITNTIAASGGCAEDVATNTITIDEAAYVDAGLNDAVCETDGSYTLINASEGGSTPSITWTTSGDGTFDDPTDINATYTFGTTGVVDTLVVTTGNPGNSCPAVSDTMLLTIDIAPIVDAGANDTICSGETYTLSGLMLGSASNITWETNGDGSFNNNALLNAVYTPGANDIANGSVQLKIKSDNPLGACSFASDSMILVINQTPTIDPQVNSSYCFGDTVNIIANSTVADVWSWTSGNGYSSNDENPVLTNVDTNNTGWYFVTAVNQITGCSVEDSVYVLVNPLPTVYAGADQTIPAGTSTAINDATSSATIYNWSPGALLVDSTVLNPVTVNLSSPTDLILSVVDPITLCQNSDTMHIAIIDCHININQLSDALCYGSSDGFARVSLENGLENYNFYLYQNGMLVDSNLYSSNSEYTFNNLPAGDYFVMINDTVNCTDTVSFTIGEPSELMFDVTVTPLSCWNNNSGSIATNVYGGTSPYFYHWNGPEGFTSDQDTINLLESGYYNLSVSDFNGCLKDLDSIFVSEPNQPDLILNIENQIQCYGDASAKITASGIGGTSPYTYTWTDGYTIYSGNELDSLSAGEYHLIVKDANQCDIADSTILLTEYEPIVLSDSIYYYGDKAGIVLFPRGGTPAYTYYWENADGDNISGESLVEDLVTGEYYVTVSDFYNCTVDTSYSIKIPFNIPTVITPNADGYNDTWSIGGIESYENVKISIFNRWGDLVFHFEGNGAEYVETSKQWDGTFKGKELPFGTYVYVLDINNSEDVYKGTITIIR